MPRSCHICGGPTASDKHSRCSPCNIEYAKKWRSSNQSKYRQSVDKILRKGRRRRDAIVSLAGGRCAECGYSKCKAALEFHHLMDKRFGLTARRCGSKTARQIRQELSKCILLCANCHREHHANT